MDDLRTDLEERGLVTDGRKKALVQRLVDNDNGEDEKSAKKDDKVKKKRSPSAYNLYMSANLAKYKVKHPSLPHKEAFSNVAALWKDSDDNPLNK
jgi:hypothetical protein